MKRALLSVWDKTNIVELAKFLIENQFEIISTGGTKEILLENNIKVTSISEVTGFNEVMNGRVKTLHPKIFGGLLADRSNKKHLKDLETIESSLIDLVVVNLYPFKEEAIDKQLDFLKAIEFIDIGQDFLTAKMPVTSKVHQPDGVLHGGASVALAESVGSAASMMFLDVDKVFIRGIEISANHVKSISEGDVFAKATYLHKGRTTQLWQIKITNTAGDLISLVKLTTIALPKK